MSALPPGARLVEVARSGGFSGRLRRTLPPPAFAVLERLRRPDARREAEALREVLQRVEERRLLAQARAGRDVCWADESEPLVTIRIATYGRGRTVVDRAVASALRQSYERIEVLVVGDHAAEDTALAMRSVTDPRVRFVNLGARSLYPERPFDRWLVAGSHPMNVANQLARGSWLAPCDDDDELTDDHVEVLLAAALERRAEFVWSDTLKELAPGAWTRIGDPRLREGGLTHGSVLIAGALRFFQYSSTSWRRREAFDWNLWRRMSAAGVRMGYLHRDTYRYHLDAMARQGLRPDSGVGFLPGVVRD